MRVISHSRTYNKDNPIKRSAYAWNDSPYVRASARLPAARHILLMVMVACVYAQSRWCSRPHRANKSFRLKRHAVRVLRRLGDVAEWHARALTSRWSSPAKPNMIIISSSIISIAGPGWWICLWQILQQGYSVWINQKLTRFQASMFVLTNRKTNKCL